MKTLALEYIKTALILIGVEGLLFIIMIMFVMTDESVGIAEKSLGVIVKYILGFPLILLDKEYPFFLNHSKPPNYMIPLILTNILIQTGVIILIKRIIKN